jgi:protein TonB
LDGEVVKAGSIEKGGTEGIGKEAEKPQPAAEVFLPIEQEAEFPGGSAAWWRYVSLEIERNMDALQEDGRSGTVVVMFVVDKDGQVSDVHALPCKEAGIPNCMGPDSELAAIAIAAVKRGPRWKPAQQNGMSVRAYRRQPVTLKMW